MFLIIRNINGSTEILKSSNSYLDKNFSDIDRALKFVKLLNKNIIPYMHWSVSKEMMNN